MKECKILRFYDPLCSRLPEDSRATHIVKTFVDYNCLWDHPMWEEELNKYLQQGWTIQSMSDSSRPMHEKHYEIMLTVLLVR